jgi:hypothetical protein
MAQAQARRSPMGRAAAKLGAYFQARGLSAADLPAAIVVHELLGAAMAAAFWTACYFARPSRALGPRLAALAGPAGAARARAAYDRAAARAAATVSKLSWMHGPGGARAARLTESLAESIAVRVAIKPATFVFKIWASAKLVELGKAAAGRGGGGGAAAMPRARGGAGRPPAASRPVTKRG